MSYTVIIVIVCIAFYIGYMILMKNKYAKQNAVVDDTDFKKEALNAEQYKKDALNDELSFLIKEMNGERIDAFTYANNKQSTGGALKQGIKDSLKGAATLGTVRFTTLNTAKYLVLSGDKLHLFDTDTDGEIDKHLVFGADRLKASSLSEITLEGPEKTAAISRGKDIRGYRLELSTDEKPIELTLYSCLIFTNIPEMPSNPHKTIEEIVIANDFLKRIGNLYPNLKVTLPF